MLDPLGGFFRIRDQYIRYLETAFRIRDTGVAKERRHLLEQAGQIATEPLFEPIARYESVPWAVEHIDTDENSPLQQFSHDVRLAVANVLRAGLFDDNSIHPYTHQIEMLKLGLSDGRPGIVTSGTGSGKTESFLLPVIAQIAAEGKQKWGAPQKTYLTQKWWHDPDTNRPYNKFTEIPISKRPRKSSPDSTPFVAHRDGEAESRSAAVRCMIIYPMNALVEDQLTRLRSALDSDAVSSVFQDELNGNRIYFGRYTGQTPVTGFQQHPRDRSSKEIERRHSRLAELFEYYVDTDRTQDEISRRLNEEPMPGERPSLSASDQFMFPRTNGSELIDRWNIQQTPPDILITNVSMLGGMLNREVDAPILDKTRKWLEENEDSYFYLVIDELHLHRGTAGTEVAYLLRSLLYRLGLNRPEHRHKLRILATSASLPVSNEAGAASLTYLWDMFGSNGTFDKNGDCAESAQDWAQAIVPGTPILEKPNSLLPLSPDLYESFFEKFELDEHVLSFDLQRHLSSDIWPEIAKGLGVQHELAPPELLRGIVEELSRKLESACWDSVERRPRATEASVISLSLFGKPGQLRALRAVLIIRAIGDLFAKDLPGEQKPAARSFRMHTFFRAIEGLFAPLDGGMTVDPAFAASKRVVGQLSVERPAVVGDTVKFRAFDMVYCECCGELFVGGVRSDQNPIFELLPSEANLEGLPQSARSNSFEDFTANEYILFWPTDSEAADDSTTKEDVTKQWPKAVLNSVTGQVVPNKAFSGHIAGPHDVQGRFYEFKKSKLEHHGRDGSSPGTHVPYSCPHCGTSYRLRPTGMRLSPIRHFRPGFSKTAQILAAELFDVLRLANPETPKLVSFSDSRQEAASAALEIESQNHEDLRRFILIQSVKDVIENINPIEIQTRIDSLKADLDLLEESDRGDDEEAEPLRRERALLRRQLVMASNSEFPLSEILENTFEPGDFIDDNPISKQPKALLRKFATLGVHPSDPAGIKRIPASGGDSKKTIDWVSLFQMNPNGDVHWRTNVLNGVNTGLFRYALVDGMTGLLGDVLFSRSYFALEETGLAYLCLSRKKDESDEAFEYNATLVRVFAEAYRVLESKYGKDIASWRDGTEASDSNRILKFLRQIHGEEARSKLGDFIARLAADQHTEGYLSIPRLHIHVTSPDDPAWVCVRCTRIHLLRGPGLCTRCHAQLSQDPNSTAREVSEKHSVGRKFIRSGAQAFRLHCEELTGQTENGAERQRKFKGLLIPDREYKRDAEGRVIYGDDDEATFEESNLFWPQREEIDLLTVTTTMEVGIDIGPLQGVLQANMPPQRFNYQQRVGRAGRRAQAFSVALTLCRTKSHDLHYFRNPRAITGDVPPPPRLAKLRTEIPLRFVNKHVLNSVFREMRDNCAEWPGDNLRPPDIHGDFMSGEDFVADSSWLGQAKASFQSQGNEFLNFIDFLLADSDVDMGPVHSGLAEVVQILANIANQAGGGRGLGLDLADSGFLPLYGMPTRTRTLYTGSDYKSQSGWGEVDRDLETAIYEFSPGAKLVKDKRQHKPNGFTGRLRKPLGKPDVPISPISEPFTRQKWLSECSSCKSWHMTIDAPGNEEECDRCGSLLPVEVWFLGREPGGFRTDFFPSTEDDFMQVRVHRTSVPVTKNNQFIDLQDTNLSIDSSRGFTLALNRGMYNAAEHIWMGYSIAEMTVKTWRGGKSPYELENQWIEQSFQQDLVSRGQGKISKPDDVAKFSLLAEKITDVLLVQPISLHPDLELSNLLSGTDFDTANPDLDVIKRTAVRAAAISASYILANSATLHLDLDLEELMVLEPRLGPAQSGNMVPVLQFADRLVNGSGLCTSLAEIEPGKSKTLLSALIHEVLHDTNAYPLKDWDTFEHRAQCTQSCYKCLLRYSNQPYHGLLDWRLGLSFLRALYEVGYVAGADGDFSDVELSDWTSKGVDGLNRLKETVPQPSSVSVYGELPLLSVETKDGMFGVVVVHPFWSEVAIARILKTLTSQFPAGLIAPDSFTVERRLWAVYRKIPNK